MRCVIRHAWTQKLLLSDPTVYFLYCSLGISAGIDSAMSSPYAHALELINEYTQRNVFA